MWQMVLKQIEVMRHSVSWDGKAHISHRAPHITNCDFYNKTTFPLFLSGIFFRS